MSSHVGYVMRNAPKDRCIEGLVEAEGRLWWHKIAWNQGFCTACWICGDFKTHPIAWRPCADPLCPHVESAPKKGEPGWDEWVARTRTGRTRMTEGHTMTAGPDWEAIARAMWGLLDDVSTLGDQYKPDQTPYVRAVGRVCEQRGQYLYSPDGQSLVRSVRKMPRDCTACTVPLEGVATRRGDQWLCADCCTPEKKDMAAALAAK